jgi:hypothetical protein
LRARQSVIHETVWYHKGANWDQDWSGHGSKARLEDRIYGCLLGGLIGDAMGAPAEGKTYQQIEERFGADSISDFEGGHRRHGHPQQLIGAYQGGGAPPATTSHRASWTMGA